MPFWKPKKKKKAVHKAKPAKSLPKYEPKPFIPPEIPKIDISANQQKEPQIVSQMMDILREERESDDH